MKLREENVTTYQQRSRYYCKKMLKITLLLQEKKYTFWKLQRINETKHPGRHEIIAKKNCNVPGTS